MNYDDEEESVVTYTMSGSGSASQNQMAIYYSPPDAQGTINVYFLGQATALAVQTNGEMPYVGPCDGLSVGDYELVLVSKDGVVTASGIATIID
ncbi:MAG: hypothetical protein LBN30_08050 [Oscillospiraceae bacterium]|jgi:hypothetical protein|nr:hypothetical protein [Oscillospiraceae bacterium]